MRAATSRPPRPRRGAARRAARDRRATRGCGSCAATAGRATRATPGGPHGWAPLLYVCHSVFASPALARELLARGADPNATFTNEYGEMSALYGAAGVVHDPELTRAAAGGGREPRRRRVGLPRDRGAEPRVPARAARARRDRRADHARPRARRRAAASTCGCCSTRASTRRELLPHAVRRGRGPEYLRLLVEHGADLEHRGGEGWRHPERRAHRLPARRAARARRVARALAELGARHDRRRRRSRGRRDRPRRAPGRACRRRSTTTSRRS